MKVKVFASAETERLHNEQDTNGLMLKLRNEKTKTLAAIIAGMREKTADKVGQRMQTPAAIWAIANLYFEARVTRPHLPEIKNPWKAADAYLQVHQEARVNAMLEPDRKGPARRRANVQFEDFDFVQHFDKGASPASIDRNDSTVQTSGILKPKPRRVHLAEPSEAPVTCPRRVGAPITIILPHVKTRG